MSSAPSAESLRSALAIAERSGVGRAYPVALRRAVVAYALAGRERGVSVTELAINLHLPIITLQRWIRRESSSVFRPAMLVESASDAPQLVLTVHGPGGLRIEGLDIAGVAELVRRLS